MRGSMFMGDAGILVTSNIAKILIGSGRTEKLGTFRFGIGGLDN